MSICPVCLSPLEVEHDRCEAFERTLADALQWAMDVLATEELIHVYTPPWLETADSLLQE